MTIREWMAQTGAMIKIDEPFDNYILDREMTEEMLQKIDEEISKAVVYSNNQLNTKFTKEKFDKFLEEVAKPRWYDDFVIFAFNEKEAEILRELYPGIKVQILPQSFKPNEYGNNSIVYTIPINDDKTLKICFEGE